MNIFVTAAVSLLATFAAIFGIYNYAPFDILSLGEEQSFGTTITTINGSDTLSGSRTTINDNFSALNNGKIENATTSVASITTLPGLTTAGSLVTVGALTSGSLASGFTAVTVPLGGTGSTTLSSGQVLLGNGASAVTTPGWGTSGQVLTSGGGGVAASWTSTSVDQTIAYNFTGSAFRVKNLHASSTPANPFTLNGLAYSTPSVRAASSTILMEDGAGALTWNDTYNRKIFATSTQPSTTQTSSTTIMNISVPANTLGTSNAIKCEFGVITALEVESTRKIWVEMAYGNSTTTLVLTQSSGGSQTWAPLTMLLMGAGATNSQKIYLGSAAAPGITSQIGKTGTPAIDSTSAQQLVVVAKADTGITYFAPDSTICTIIK